MFFSHQRYLRQKHKGGDIITYAHPMFVNSSNWCCCLIYALKFIGFSLAMFSPFYWPEDREEGIKQPGYLSPRLQGGTTGREKLQRERNEWKQNYSEEILTISSPWNEGLLSSRRRSFLPPIFYPPIHYHCNFTTSGTTAWEVAGFVNDHISKWTTDRSLPRLPALMSASNPLRSFRFPCSGMVPISTASLLIGFSLPSFRFFFASPALGKTRPSLLNIFPMALMARVFLKCAYVCQWNLPLSGHDSGAQHVLRVLHTFQYFPPPLVC